MEDAHPRPLIRFGRFVVDRSTHELRRNGLRIPLQEKQFRLLVALLERPNEVVLRTELEKTLWPDDDYGDFQTGLNQAVRRLRRALDDSARDPKWIETIPKVGYRFIGRLKAAPDYRRAVAILGAAAAGIVLTIWILRLDPPPVSAALDVSIFEEIALTSYQGQEMAPSFSPDGRQIAYAAQRPGSAAWNIFVEEIGSRKPRRLTDTSDQNLGPAWSPDGRTIAFIRRESTMVGGSLMIAPVTGGPPTKLADLDCRDFWGLAVDWSPDGSRIAFAARAEANSPIQIGLFDVASAQSRWLTNPELGIIGDTQPVFSPDGSSLAFVRQRGYSSGWNVFKLKLKPNFTADGDPRRLTRFERAATSPQWSPNGKSLFFIGERDAGQEGIWETSPDGQGEPELIWRSTGAMPESAFDTPSLAVGQDPDGELLIAYSFGATRDEDIYRVELTGPRRGKASKLISTSFRDTYPRYSPDGSRIVFHSGRPTRDLWLADADGENLKRISNLESRVVGPPDWSPDGTRIAFHSRHAGPANIYIVRADSHRLRPLIESPADDVLPTWSRDGSSIYFLSNRSGDWAVWKIPVEGGVPRKLFDRWAPTVAESWDGKSLFFNDSKTGDFLEAQLDSLDDPSLLLAQANREILAFNAGRSGLYFLERGQDFTERSPLRTAAAGMLSLLHLPGGHVESLFQVKGYLSSIAPDESHILMVRGSPPEVDLRLVRPASPRSPRSATSNHRSARRLE